MFKRLNVSGTHRAMDGIRIEMFHSCPEWLGVKKKLVPDVTLLWSGGGTPNPSPDIPRRIGQTSDGALIPLQSAVDTLLLIEKAPSLSSCKFWKRRVSSE